jgi:hypothetical protein
MRRREATSIRESDLASVEGQYALQRRISFKESDAHRAASGGASVVLRSRDTKHGVRISQMDADELDIGHGEHGFSRAVARGGLLCDDPGLGKTVTVLSLISQTMGLSTESTDKSDSTGVDGVENSDTSSIEDRIFHEYWNGYVVPDLQQQALTKIFSRFLRTGADIFYFFQNTDPMNEIVQNSISLRDIRERIQSPGYDNFLAFETDVKLCFMNAMVSNPVQSPIHDAAGRLTTIFSNMIKDFKEATIKIARKSFSSTSAKPDSRVAALVEKSNELKLKNSLVPSSGTLLVVPNNLLDHWTVRFSSFNSVPVF